MRHGPVYALGEWAGRYDPATVGLAGHDIAALNDDRVGRMLARLFDADIASMLPRLVLDAVESFGIDLPRLHDDSTSIRLSGAYDTANGHTRGGKSTPAVRHGLSKDHRPDLKQLVWMLTVTADGAVPIAFRVADGHTSDVTSLIERTIRQAMAQAGLDQLSLYPEDRGCAARPPPGSSRSTPASPTTSSPTPTAPCCTPSILS